MFGVPQSDSLDLMDCFYSIVSSYTIRPRSKFNVAVSVHKAVGSCSFKITLKGPSYEDHKCIDVQPLTTGHLEFDVPAIIDGDYELFAEGLKGIIFTISIRLGYDNDDPVVLIQLDKATYKPGDLVRFRAIFMDDKMRPINPDKPIHITISDSQKNRLKQWKDVELKTGVYVGNYQLSDQPVLGDWRIDVTVEGQTLKTQLFEVAKYVLPKFCVSIETDQDVALHDGIINVTVRAQYTFGKGVMGKAIVSCYDAKESRNTGAEKTVDINGKGHVQFKFGEDFNVDREFNTRMEISVVVEEELTGSKMEATTSIEIHIDRFRFQGVDNPYEFKPEKPLTIKVAVTTFDYKPVIDDKNPIKLIIENTPHYIKNEEIETTEKLLTELVSNLDEHGIASFEYTFPENDKNYYYLKCQYLECESHLTTLSKYEEPEIEEFDALRLDVLTERPKLKQNVEIEVSSRDPMSYFVYTIHARGKYLKTELVLLPKNTKRHVINVTPTFNMVPIVSIFVHYVSEKELIYAETSISFDREFENYINIVAPTETSPGDDVPITIRSNPESYVGLLGVDQSVLLLKSGNDLNADEIFNNFDNFIGCGFAYPKARCPGENSGLNVITNANHPDVSQMLIMGHEMLRAEGSKLVWTCCSTENAEPRTPKIRKRFLESWIFEDIECLSSSCVVLQKTIPDSITSWVITGFSINPKTGLAITKNPALIRTFRPFFIGTNLPYSIKRGEQVTIPVIVFNYMDQDLNADIIMDNTEHELDFIEPGSDRTKRTKSITVSANASESVNFTIRPNRIGDITLKITAISPVAGDTIHKELKVEPEGIGVFKNRDYYLHTEGDGDGNLNAKSTVQLDIPHEVVPESEFIEVSVMGNILSSTITNIDNLVRLPCGCGEQIMVNFVPNILILWYLESIQELTTTIEEKAKRFLEIGYQSELTYKHDDGSYSAFGKSDASGSTWLTAYVIRCFHQAKKYIDIDSKILDEGLTFLSNAQASNGSFAEVGRLFDSAHMNEVGLTAFVLLTFLENSESLDHYKETIDQGFEYLQQNLRNTDDLYALSVAVYALQQRKLDVVHEILGKLETLARIDGGRKYWTEEENQKNKNSWYVSSHDVEITGYILMTLLDMNVSVLPITRWLISQRNSNGGYGSTQDTVVGLWALIKFAEKMGATNPDMNIDIITPVSEKPMKTFSVNKSNSMITQSLELPKDTRKIVFTGKGTGTAVLQISYRYNVFEKEKKPSFKLSTKMKPTVSRSFLSMDIEAEFSPEENVINSSSNMAIMEVALPSGFTAVVDSLQKIRELENVKRVDLKDDDTKIVIYFDNLKIAEKKSIPVEAELSHTVVGQRPTPIVIYDYYDNQNRATEFYEVQESSAKE